MCCMEFILQKDPVLSWTEENASSMRVNVGECTEIRDTWTVGNLNTKAQGVLNFYLTLHVHDCTCETGTNQNSIPILAKMLIQATTLVWHVQCKFKQFWPCTDKSRRLAKLVVMHMKSCDLQPRLQTAMEERKLKYFTLQRLLSRLISY